MLNKDLAFRRAESITSSVAVSTEVYADHALNAELWDVEGKRYIDFAAGIAVLNTGHRHPKVIDAVKKQLDRFTHTAHQVIPYENYIVLAERLNKAAPGDFKKKTLFVTSGSEAIENAVKIARVATGRSAVIAFNGCFHGRTYMAMSLTGKVNPYKLGCGPMAPDIFHVPFPIALHGITEKECIAAIDKLFKVAVDPKRVAAFLIEPVQGEGGFYEVPKSFMSALRKIADEHGILLIADEVQCGFGRTGKLFAMENHDVVSDLTAMAKGLGGGFPIAAVTGRADIMDKPTLGALGGTYGGNPMAVAAANAVLDVIAEEKLCDRANKLGARLKQQLQSLASSIPEIADVRGLGLMVAIEFNKPNSKTPDVEFTTKFRKKALENGLILLACGVYSNVIRFLSPLTIEDNVFEEALGIIEKTLREC